MKGIASIKRTEIIILVIPDKTYASRMKELVSSLSSSHNRICYVSLNKPYSATVEMIKKYGADTNKFFFVDCTEKRADEKAGQVVNVSSPKALTEMSITISKVMDLGKIDALIFDSLSTLMVYEEPSIVVKFAHSLISTLRSKKVTGALVCLEGGKNTELVKDISMFADSVIN
jgi:hypothetical protein